MGNYQEISKKIIGIFHRLTQAQWHCVLSILILNKARLLYTVHDRSAVGDDR